MTFNCAKQPLTKTRKKPQKNGKMRDHAFLTKVRVFPNHELSDKCPTLLPNDATKVYACLSVLPSPRAVFSRKCKRLQSLRKLRSFFQAAQHTKNIPTKAKKKHPLAIMHICLLSSGQCSQ